jgi:3-hydroxybutyryl-CoA dehydrogenase
MQMSEKPFSVIGVVGAGTMGAQIALHCAVHGYTVRLFSRSDRTLQKAARSHGAELAKRVERGDMSDEEKQPVLQRIAYTEDMQLTVAAADLVIENVPEQLQIKRETFSLLDRLCPAHTVLATDSSSIRISAIEDATMRPERVLNMHFYSHMWRRPMVELMAGTKTSIETMNRARRFVQSLQLTPLHVLKESTGFVFNRVWRAIKKECLHLVDDGIASHEDVDRAWMIAFGASAGPFAMMDAVGLDVVRDIEMVYQRESGSLSDAPPRLLLDKIAIGELGVKTGKGFYGYPDPAYKTAGWLKGHGE